MASKKSLWWTPVPIGAALGVLWGIINFWVEAESNRPNKWMEMLILPILRSVDSCRSDCMHWIILLPLISIIIGALLGAILVYLLADMIKTFE